jgi:hypothetical protein
MNRDLLIGDVFRNASRAVPNRVAAALGKATLTFGPVDSWANAIVRALMLNNGVLGETGGHLTATTVLGQRTTL